MSYEEFANPSDGYNKNADKGPGYSWNPNAATGYTPDPKAITTQRITPVPAVPIPSLGEFVELPVKSGVGNYHFNHFIGYFKLSALPSDTFLRSLNRQFFNSNNFRKSFSTIFSSKNIASIAPSRGFKFNGQDTIEFQIGGNLGNWISQLGGDLHSDWVSMQMADNNESFYASTLKRQWIEKDESQFFKLLARVLAPKGEEAKFVANAITVNQHHFLAGKRSFKVGYDNVKKVYFVETAAFERSSICEYYSIEKTGALRGAIIDLWTNLIMNYAQVFKVDLSKISFPPDISYLPKDYLVKGNVAYRIGEDKSIGNALKIDWFSNVLQRHPILVKDL